MKKLAPSALILFLLTITGCSSDDNTSNIDEPAVLVINEFKANVPEDDHAKQYIELRGTPEMEISNTYIVVIDGDNDEAGNVDYVYSLNGIKLGANGLLLIKNANEYNDAPADTILINEPLFKTYDPNVDGESYEDGMLEHDAITYALIQSSTIIQIGDDLDSNDDGNLNLSSDAKVIDAVGSLNAGDGYVYSDVILSQSASDPDAASRFYGNLNANDLSAWANGDIYEDPEKEDAELSAELLYDTLQASSNLPPKAALTPGGHNFKQAPFVLINEVVNQGAKYIELLSNASANLNDIYLLVLLDDDQGIVSISRDLTGLVAKETGITIIKHNGLNMTIGSAITAVDENLESLNSATSSVILVYSPVAEIKQGDDLDLNDDGQLTLPDSAIVLDNIGWGNSRYSDIKTTDIVVTASRYKDNRMVTLAAWSFDSQYKTPANTNIAASATMLVKPTLETDRTEQSQADADDIAIWIDATAPQYGSLIIGSQKVAGYSVYDVEGNTLLDVKPDNIRYNNVDIMYGFELAGIMVDLAVFTNRISNKFVIYTISAQAPYLTDVTDYDDSSELFDAEETSGDTAYGQAVYKNPLDNQFYVYASQNGHALVAQFKLHANGNKIGWSKVRMISLEADDDDKHAEGMVVDQEYGKLYIAQEEVGIYLLDALGSVDISLGEADMLIKEGDFNLVEDLEGLTLFYKDNGEGYFIVSSQGNNTYGVFDRTQLGVKNNFIQSFAVVDNMDGIDGTQETDSIDVTNISLGSQFPHGAFIVQDGIDTTSDPDDTKTNFKWIAWDKVASSLGDLDSSSTYDPRNPENRR